MQNKLLYIIYLTYILLHSFSVEAQVNICGYIKDKKNDNPVPFVHIVSQNNLLLGAVSEENGSFCIKNLSFNDTLLVSAVGYEKFSICVKDLKAKGNIILLIANTVSLQTVVIHSGMKLAQILINNMWAHRDKLNPDKMTNYSLLTTSKSMISVSNINILKNPWLKNQFKNNLIEKNDSIYVLPTQYANVVKFKEVSPQGNVRDTIFYSQRDGISIFDESFFEEITEDLIKNTNFYDSYIPILGKYIPSPISSNSFFYYKLFVVDSAEIGGCKNYKIEYFPKNKQDLTFVGYFWINAKTYSITEIEARLSEGANINFLREFNIHNTFQSIGDSTFFYLHKRAELIFDYNLLSDSVKNITINIVKNVDYSDININKKDKQVSIRNIDKIKRKIDTLKIVDSADIEYYDKIAKLKENMFVIIGDKLSYVVINAYYNAGIIDIGPLTDVYRKNKIEGNRYTVGLRTNEKLSKKISIGGFVGYGMKDKKIKFGANALYKFNGLKYNKLSAEYWQDIDNISFNDNIYLLKENSMARNEDNIISAFFALKPSKFLVKRENYTLSFEHDIAKGVTETFSLQHNTIWNNKFIGFRNNSNLMFSEINYTLRFSFKEKYFEEYFRRIYLGNKYPIINLKLTYGNYKLDSFRRSYYKIHSTLKHRFNFAIGVFKYVIEAGIIFGSVPFPILEIHRGNQTLGLARFSFNMLNNLEYASDKYASLQGIYKTNGFIFNRIPLLKKLNLRENANFKIIYGSLGNKHRTITEFPWTLSGVKSPYIEAGVGVENIFKILSVEYIWRLTDRNKRHTANSGVRLRFEFNF